MVRPTPVPVTSPPESTRATSGLRDLIVTLPIETGVPSSFKAWARIRAVSPGIKVSAGGSRVRTDAVDARVPAGSPGALPVMSTARDARFPCDRASILARPGFMPTTVPSFLTCGDQTVRAPEGEFGGGNEVASRVEGGGKERLFLAYTQSHRLWGNLDLGHGLSPARRADRCCNSKYPNEDGAIHLGAGLARRLTGETTAEFTRA